MQLDLDLTTKEGVAELLSSSEDELQWDDNCEKILEANGGEYPEFWLLVACPIAATLTKQWKEVKVS
jgi:hypothetical protein